MNYQKLCTTLCLFLCLVLISPAQSLKVGDPAPALNVEAWIKGEPVQRFEPGTVYVLEFWATWCMPCKAAMPHLSELSRRFRDKAVFIGVDVREGEPTNGTLRTVKKFVEMAGDLMDYSVAYDGNGTTFKDYMESAGFKNIPTSFVIDQQGKVAWIGHPQMGLEEAVTSAINGQEIKDSEQAVRWKEVLKILAQSSEVIKPLKDAEASEDYEQVLVEADKLAEKGPKYVHYVSSAKFKAWLHLDEDKAFAYAKEEFDKEKGLSRNSAANIILDTPGCSEAAYRFALESLEPDNEQYKDRYWHHKLLSKLYLRLGERQEAVAAMKKAVECAEVDENVGPVILKELKYKLEELEDALLQNASALSMLQEEAGNDFLPPFRLKAGNDYITVDHGHAAPLYTDFDGDGIRDLLVGQFGDGELRIYKNHGTNTNPQFEGFEWFQAGGTTGKVPTG